MTDETIPAALRPYFSTLEEQVHSERPGDAFNRCFGCGPGHPTGLHVRCFRTDTGVASPIVIAKQYEGPPGAAHGGIVAAYLDEILGGAVYRATAKVAVTGELTVRYRRPVPTERAVLGRGRLVADHGRYIDVEGDLVDPDTKEILATGKGRFFPAKPGGAEP